MDRVLNPRDEKQTIYEIYRACRLCGAGAGYKMPIIQNVVNLEGEAIELRDKIKECVQIEVNHTDRMPPLICELCVDKVNDFYEFLNMCKQNNKRTRIRLGLPLHTPSRDSTESDNCILGVTEPVFVATEPPNRVKSKKSKLKKDPVEVKVKTVLPPPKAELKAPPRPGEAQWAVLSRSRQPAAARRPTRQTVEPVLTPPEDVLELERKLKRAREIEMKDTAPPSKKVKTIPESHKTPINKPKVLKETPKTVPKPQPKLIKNIKSPPPKPTSKPTSKAVQSKPTSKPVNSKPNSKVVNSKVVNSKVVNSKEVNSKVVKSKSVEPNKFICLICNVQVKTSQGLFQHNSFKHVPAITNPKYACNACELWFPTVEEAVVHHRHHRTQNVPYKCTRCYGYFKLQLAYEEHFSRGQCLSEWEAPDVRCAACWRGFPTQRLLDTHRCAGEDGRPGGKCAKCNRSYALLKNLLKHESTCTHRKKGEPIPGMLPMRVRISRCDALLDGGAPVHCAALPQNYGLDRSCHYPYFRRVKTEQPMVAIQETVKREYSTRVDTLSSLCLRTLQTNKRLKTEPYDDNDDDLTAKIDTIIDQLGDEESQSNDSSSILNVGKKDNDNCDDIEDVNTVGDTSGKEIGETEDSNDKSENKDVTKGVSDSVLNNDDVGNNVEDSVNKENEQKDVENVGNLGVSEKNEKESVLEYEKDEVIDEIRADVDRIGCSNENEDTRIETAKSNHENFTKIDEITNKILENEETKDNINVKIAENTVNTQNLIVSVSDTNNLTDKALDIQMNNKTDSNEIAKENVDNETNKDSEDFNENNEQVAKTNLDNEESNKDYDEFDENDQVKENGVNSKEKFNMNDLSEEDRKLMADIDEQIGESDEKCDNPNDNEKSKDNDMMNEDNDMLNKDNDMINKDNDIKKDEYNENVKMSENKNANNDMEVDDKTEINNRSETEQKINVQSRNHYIDELIKKQDDMRSLDLDSISDDDFNFDI